MNCKPGDLAVQVGCYGNYTENIGAIVECIRCYVGVQGDVRWVINPLTPNYKQLPDCADKFLRPIRPQSDDADDEMLLLVSKPEGVPA